MGLYSYIYLFSVISESQIDSRDSLASEPSILYTYTRTVTMVGMLYSLAQSVPSARCAMSRPGAAVCTTSVSTALTTFAVSAGSLS